MSLQIISRLFGPSVQLSLPEATGSPADAPKPTWVQIAVTGEWRGHKIGKIKFTKSDTANRAVAFSQVIENFRKHPSYKCGPDGIGCAKVVPFDYEHASEQPATSGSIPVAGAPAPAWALELKTVDSGDKTELWALTEFGEQARGQVGRGEYQFTSVAIWPDYVDHVSAKNIGAVLTSIALTNHPFIQGMAPMQARSEVWGEAESPEELMLGLRSIFELECDAGVEEIKKQVERLTTAVGMEVGTSLREVAESICSRVRSLLALPRLSTNAEILSSLGQAISALADSNGSSTEPTGETEAMSLSEQLAAILKAAGATTDAQILFAVKAAVDAQEELAQLKSVVAGITPTSLALLKSEADRGGVIKLALNAAGYATDTEKEAATVATLLKSALPELSKLREAQEAADVDGFLNGQPLTDEVRANLRPVLLSQRQACSGDAKAIEGFQAKYPSPKEPGATGNAGITLGGAKISQLTTSISGAPAGGGMLLGGPQGNAGKPAHPMDSYAGPNQIAKAISYLCDAKPGFKSLSFEEQNRQAGAYVREGRPILGK